MPDHGAPALSSVSPSIPEAGGLPDKPVYAEIVFEAIPTALRERAQWLVWRYKPMIDKHGEFKRWTKPPVDVRTGFGGKSNDPSTWADLARCAMAYRRGEYDGVGFAFQPGDGITGIDLDHCLNRETGEWDARAVEILERFKGTYCEISPSGEGLRIFCYGKPGRSGKNDGQPKWLEVYDADSPRYLTVTGHVWFGCGAEISEQQAALDWLHGQYFAGQAPAAPHPAPARPREPRPPAGPVADLAGDDRALIERASGSKNGLEFRRLYEGDISGYNNNPSDADMAFCGKLAFWTNKDADRMDRIFRTSGLMRPKWDEMRGRATYAAITIEKAIRNCKEGYKPRPARSSPPAAPRAAAPPPVVEPGDHPPPLVLYEDEGREEKEALRAAVERNTRDGAGASGDNAPPGPRGGGGANDGDGAGRPLIRITGGSLVEVVALSEKALLTGDQRFPPLFQRSGQLVRVVREVRPSEEGCLHRPAGALSIVDADVHWLTHEFQKRADYEKWSVRDKEWVRLDVPDKYAQKYLSLRQWAAKPLEGIIEAPTMRRDGSLLTEKGYDAASGVYFHAALDFEVPEGPVSDEDVNWAKDLFHELFDSFSPDQPHDFSAFVAAVLTALVRPMLPLAPGFAIRAPMMGSGKTKIAKVIGMVALGRDISVITMPKDNEAEFEKRFDVALLKGDPIILIDNIERPLDSPLLNAVFTSSMADVRVLGKSESPKIQTNRTMMITGNNLLLNGDLTRRFLTIDINPQCEKPYDREFDSDPVEVALERRVELVKAALMLLKRYRDDGRPSVCTPLGSFEVWSKVVRSAVIHAGLPDPCLGLQDWEQTDTVRVTLRNLLRLCHERWGAGAFRAGEVTGEATEGSELAEVLADVCQERNGKFSVKTLGRWLGKYVDRIEGGLALKKSGTSHSTTLWKVVPAGKKGD